jgi:hypothetical protein
MRASSTRMAPVIRSLPIAAALALALTVAGCGGGDTTTVVEKSTDTVTVTETTATQTSTPGEPVDCNLPVPQGGGQYDLFATDLDCDTAKTVVIRWVYGCLNAPDNKPCEADMDFSCTYRPTGDEVGQVTCTRSDGGAELTFETGA